MVLLPDASPDGHILGFGISVNTVREEKQGQEDRDEKEEKSMKRECLSKLLTSIFAFLDKSTWEKQVIESEMCPNGDAPAALLLVEHALKCKNPPYNFHCQVCAAVLRDSQTIGPGLFQN